MKKVSIEFEFDDNFEPGDCDICPLSYQEQYYALETGYDYWNSCVMNSRYDECYLRDKFNIK